MLGVVFNCLIWRKGLKKSFFAFMVQSNIFIVNFLNYPIRAAVVDDQAHFALSDVEIKLGTGRHLYHKLREESISAECLKPIRFLCPTDHRVKIMNFISAKDLLGVVPNNTYDCVTFKKFLSNVISLAEEEDIKEAALPIKPKKDTKKDKALAQQLLEAQTLLKQFHSEAMKLEEVLSKLKEL